MNVFKELERLYSDNIPKIMNDDNPRELQNETQSYVYVIIIYS